MYAAQMVLVMNNTTPHTYFKVFPGGTLFSERYITTRWVFLMLALLRILVPITVLSMVLYRRSFGCTVVWMVALVLLVIVDTLVLVALGIDYGGCNGQNQFGNLCNSIDPEWCCVPEIFSNPLNMCPNSLDCTPAVALVDLGPRSDFVWLFYVTLAFVVLDYILLLVPLWLWLGGPIVGVKYATGEEEEEQLVGGRYPPMLDRGKKQPLQALRVHAQRRRTGNGQSSNTFGDIIHHVPGGIQNGSEKVN